MEDRDGPDNGQDPRAVEQNSDPATERTPEITLSVVDLVEAGQERTEQPETQPQDDPIIVAPTPVRPAPAPLQPLQQSVWAKKAVLMKRKRNSYKSKSEPIPTYPPVPPPKARRQSYVPVVPSPLNPASSGSEGDVSASGRPSHSSGETRDVNIINASGSLQNSASSEPARKSQTSYSTPTLAPCK
ncbi:hypothetical protein ABW19_dt0203803 [Dactylella cylindrospora]|nr:hypothetical protein ABW19_dt0203803 [Dactylella cylindrospora]